MAELGAYYRLTDLSARTVDLRSLAMPNRPLATYLSPFLIAHEAAPIPPFEQKPFGLNDWLYNALHEHSQRLGASEPIDVRCFGRFECLVALNESYRQLTSGGIVIPLGRFADQRGAQNQVMADVADLVEDTDQGGALLESRLCGRDAEDIKNHLARVARYAMARLGQGWNTST